MLGNADFKRHTWGILIKRLFRRAPIAVFDVDLIVHGVIVTVTKLDFGTARPFVDNITG